MHMTCQEEKSLVWLAHPKRCAYARLLPQATGGIAHPHAVLRKRNRRAKKRAVLRLRNRLAAGRMRATAKREHIAKPSAAYARNREAVST